MNTMVGYIEARQTADALTARSIEKVAVPFQAISYLMGHRAGQKASQKHIETLFGIKGRKMRGKELADEIKKRQQTTLALVGGGGAVGGIATGGAAGFAAGRSGRRDKRS